MKPKVIAGMIVVVGFLIFGAKSFLETTIEYTDFVHAKQNGKKVSVKGQWIQERGSAYDPKENHFIFYMRDSSQNGVKVVLDGPKPNNFELASLVVAIGRFESGYFHASQVLTKCPSKYEATDNQSNKN